MYFVHIFLSLISSQILPTSLLLTFCLSKKNYIFSIQEKKRNTTYDRWYKRLWKFLRELYFLEKQGAYVMCLFVFPGGYSFFFLWSLGERRAVGTLSGRPHHSSSFLILLDQSPNCVYSHLTLGVSHGSWVLLILFDVLSVPSKDYLIYHLLNFLHWFSWETALLI